MFSISMELKFVDKNDMHNHPYCKMFRRLVGSVWVVTPRIGASPTDAYKQTSTSNSIPVKANQTIAFK